MVLSLAGIFKTPDINPARIALAVFAITLQIQLTLFASHTYLGLRVNSADMLLPFVLLVAGVTLCFRISDWPGWQIKNLYIWLAALFLILTIALIRGHDSNGYWSSWAIINKYAGFLILCGYFVLGGWIVRNAKIPENVTSHFMNWFCGFFLLIVTTSAVFITIQNFVPYDLWLSDFAWDGFMANRNAFMIVAVFVMIYLICDRTEFSFSLSQWMHHLFWFLLPIFCLYNASRTGWIAMVVITVLYLYKNPVRKMKVIVPFLMLGIVLATVSFYTSTIPMNEKKRQFMRMLSGSYDLTTTENEAVVFVEGDQHRLIAVEDGFDLYSKSNPILGAGLGTYKEFQIEKRGEFINLIDFTALWLLVETGALGLGAFAAFFLVGIMALYQSGWRANSTFHKAMFFYLITFAGMSVMHELMYSRFLWFAMGMALAQTLRKVDR